MQKTVPQSASTVHPSPVYSVFRNHSNTSSNGCPHLYKSVELLNAYQSLVRYSKAVHNRWQLSFNKKIWLAELLGPDTDNQKKKKKFNKLEKELSVIEKLETPCCFACSACSKVYICLHCIYFACSMHMPSHFKKHGHALGALRIHLALNLEDCELFCYHCNDFVYDIDLEKIRDMETCKVSNTISLVKDPTHKRIRYNPWVPTFQEQEIIRKKAKPVACSGIRGLRNVGSTCFMNVILQTFVHNPPLRAHFLSDRHPSGLCSIKNCLACEMDALFTQCYNGSTTPFAPVSFLCSIWQSQSHLAGYSEKDAHEFFISVLNEVHNNCSDCHSTGNCQCIIHQVFGGVLQSNVTCMKCSNVTTVLDPILDVSLDIKNVTINDHEEPNLLQCLEKFTRAERLEYSCSSCGTSQEAVKQLSMKKLPTVLAIQLKRFEHSLTQTCKIETFVKVPEILDMTPYTSRNMKVYANTHYEPSQNYVPAYQYRLFAVVHHTGKLETGHYTMHASCKDQWYLFDDHKVSNVDLLQVLRGQPYMLFYIKCHHEFSPLLALEVPPNGPLQ